MRQTINLPMRDISHARFLEKARHILNSLQSQPNVQVAKAAPFVDGEKIEIPFWNDLDEAVNNYADAIERSLSRSLVSLEILKEVRLHLYQVIKTIKSYLETYYGTNASALLSTGFDVSKTPAPKVTPPAPEKLIVKATDIGEITLTTAPYSKGKGYQFEYCEENDMVWKVIVHSRSKLVLNQLKSKTTYHFRVAYIGTTDSRKYSSVVVSNVL